MNKKEEIAALLIDDFDRINMDTPNNFDEILEFVYEDVCETADEVEWHSGDVTIGFRRWIESNINKKKIDIMTTYERLSEEQIVELDKAVGKVTIELLESLKPGDEIELIKGFCLYHYTEEDVVVLNSVEEWDELFQVMWDNSTKQITFEEL